MSESIAPPKLPKTSANLQWLIRMDIINVQIDDGSLSENISEFLDEFRWTDYSVLFTVPTTEHYRASYKRSHFK